MPNYADLRMEGVWPHLTVSAQVAIDMLRSPPVLIAEITVANEGNLLAPTCQVEIFRAELQTPPYDHGLSAYASLLSEIMPMQAQESRRLDPWEHTLASDEHIVVIVHDPLFDPIRFSVVDPAERQVANIQGFGPQPP